MDRTLAGARVAPAETISQGELGNEQTDHRECACTYCRFRIGIRGGLVRDIAVYLDPRHELCPKVGDDHLQAAV